MSEHPAALADRLVRESQRFRYRLDIEYDGTNFHGMQMQPELRTVQTCLEDALRPLFEADIRVIPSSRTDAGVHAAQQVIHFDAPIERPLQSIVRGTNVSLPADVRVLSARSVDETFHARFSAKWRGYVYLIEFQPTALRRHYVWQYFMRPDLNALQALADEIRGTHSFASFAHEVPNEEHNYECTVMRSKWTATEHGIAYHIEANRFLHGMVRLLVGTMMDITLGARSMASCTMGEILAQRDNRRAGTKAPAHGLTLQAVGYDGWPGL